MLARYCGPGLLGLGITALIAGFMSGMAGNVSAFATVWTYDIYRAMIKQGRHRRALRLAMGRWCTVIGVLVSIGTAYLVMHAQQHHGLRAGALQLLHRPAVRHRHPSACSGSAPRPPADSGACSPAPSPPSACGPWVKIDPSALQYVALSPDAKAMAENMYRALWSWLICAGVTVVVSLVTKPEPESSLVGLVYGCTPIPSEGDLPLYPAPHLLGRRSRRRLRHPADYLLVNAMHRHWNAFPSGSSSACSCSPMES